jgi:arylformamidase
MSFDDLPPLPTLRSPDARAYAERISNASRIVQTQTRTALDLPYGDDYWQKIDLYLPAAEGRGLPVLCFLHGGAWVNGTKEWMGFMAPPLIDMPAIFASVNYRLAPAARYPAAFDDCLDAVAWIHRNIARFGGDPARIFLGGHSAGGHLAALVTLRRDLLRARGLPSNVIRACFPVSGAFDMRCDNPPPGSLEEVVNTAFLARLADAPDASPVTFVAGNDTPFYLAWGSRDIPSLILQGRAMAAALRQHEGAVAVEEFAGLDHFLMNEDAGRRDSLWVARVRRWMAGTFD